MISLTLKTPNPLLKTINPENKKTKQQYQIGTSNPSMLRCRDQQTQVALVLRPTNPSLGSCASVEIVIFGFLL